MVYVYRIAASNTIDEQVIDRLRGKATLQEALQNALKRLRAQEPTND